MASPATVSCGTGRAPVSVVDLLLLLASTEMLGSPFPAVGLHCLTCEARVSEDSPVCYVCVIVPCKEQLVFIVNCMPGVLQDTIT